MMSVSDLMIRMGQAIVNNSCALWLAEMLDNRFDNQMRERGMISHAFEFKAINGVAGDYFEFGLWRGKTFGYALRARERYRQNSMQLWGFDSFQGLPAIDDSKDNIWREGDFACSEPELRKILKRKGFSDDKYELVPGFYEETLCDGLHRRLDGRTAAIVYIDCDLYRSTSLVLSFMERYFVNGTILCFDDFYNYKAVANQGEQRALREFMDTRPEIRMLPYLDYSPLGKSFIVRRTGD